MTYCVKIRLTFLNNPSFWYAEDLFHLHEAYVLKYNILANIVNQASSVIYI